MSEATAIQPREPGRLLHEAFVSFNAAAASLERSYQSLQSELGRLRIELEEKNRTLAASLEENRRMRRHLDAIVAALPCGVVVWQAEGGVSLLNPAARELMAVLHRNFQLPEERIISEFCARSADGSSRDVECRDANVACIHLRHALVGAPEAKEFVLILEDVSEARRWEKERETMRRKQALADLATLLAHEVRNPLGSLELFAGLLAGAELKADAKDWAGHLQAGLRRLSATVNNVLQFHSTHHGQLRLVDVGPWLASMRSFVAPVIWQAGLQLELRARLEGVRIAGDRHRLDQVLLNLLVNAVHATSPGGQIRLTGRVESGCVLLAVSDTGCGIASQHWARLFEPGFSTRPGSPGLGLAVCKTIVEDHGGKILLHSLPGKGTTVELRFALAQETACGAAA
jgi:two-component system sensor histidine kinase FlrB